MSDPNKLNFGADEPVIEVEMSADDLLALSPSRAIEKREPGATPLAAAPPMTKEAVAARAQPAQPLHTHSTPPSLDRRSSASRVALPMSILVGAVTAGIVIYMSVTPDRPDRASSTTMLQRVTEREWSAATPEPEPEPEPEGEPVRFANPFDENEVFEFPPGTSNGEVRDAVADMLMKRAMERQAMR